jgi:hypothetical protein
MKSCESGSKVSKWVEDTHKSAPIEIDLRESTSKEMTDESGMESDELPQSDTSDSEMRVIRGGGDNRSSVPENTINPHDSPRERRTSVAPATRPAGGKSTHALTPAKSDKRPLVAGGEEGESERGPAWEYGQEKSSKREENKASMMRRRAEKAPHCKTMIWRDEADHREKEIVSHRECDEKGYSRKRGYELEIGKEKTDTVPASHHKKRPPSDSRGIQLTPSTTIPIRKQVPPSNSRQNARYWTLDALDVATRAPATATSYITGLEINSIKCRRVIFDARTTRKVP